MAKHQVGGNKIFHEFLKEAGPTELTEKQKQSERVRACAKDMRVFAQIYFPDIYDKDFCEFHNEIIDSLHDMVFNKKTMKNFYCRAAPRGHGKSQIISFLLILWCICYNYKKNILLISDTNDQAKSFIMAIKAELEDNELLIEDFGELAGKSIWSQDKIETANKIHVFGRGSGQRLRGAKHRNTRPDLIVIDDLESDEQVETPNQRTKLRNWFMKALLPVGTPQTDHVYIGTILHYEALLNTVLTDKKFAAWNRKIYQAVYTFSDSPLWDEWEKIMLDLSREDPAADAYALYQANRDAMLEGTDTLWPDQDADYYYNLMVTRLMDEASFLSEFQNSPVDPSKAEFQEEWLKYYDELPEIVEIHGACDPSLGKQRSDRGAIVWIGKGKDNFLYVLEVEMGRYKPDMLIDMIIAGAVRYQNLPTKISVETVQFQAMFKDELEKRALNAGIPLDIVEYNSKTEKELRIRGLIPKVKNGYIRFKMSMVALLNELRRFPKSSDDGLDALQMAVATAYPAASGFCFGKVQYAVSALVNKMKGR